MGTLTCITCIVLTAILCACRSSSSRINAAPKPAPVRLASGWSLPSGLPTFGEAGTDTIRVVVFVDVHRPGYYHLHNGALVRDAVEAAQGLKKISSYRGYSHSSIARQTADGSYEIIWFTRGREVEEQVPLKDGDQLRFDHEAF